MHASETPHPILVVGPERVIACTVQVVRTIMPAPTSYQPNYQPVGLDEAIRAAETERRNSDEMASRARAKSKDVVLPAAEPEATTTVACWEPDPASGGTLRVLRELTPALARSLQTREIATDLVSRSVAAAYAKNPSGFEWDAVSGGFVRAPAVAPPQPPTAAAAVPEDIPSGWVFDSESGGLLRVAQPDGETTCDAVEMREEWLYDAASGGYLRYKGGQPASMSEEAEPTPAPAPDAEKVVAWLHDPESGGFVRTLVEAPPSPAHVTRPPAPPAVEPELVAVWEDDPETGGSILRHVPPPLEPLVVPAGWVHDAASGGLVRVAREEDVAEHEGGYVGEGTGRAQAVALVTSAVTTAAVTIDVSVPNGVEDAGTLKAGVDAAGTTAHAGTNCESLAGPAASTKAASPEKKRRSSWFGRARAGSKKGK